eukprot:jgi/Chrzof1/10135/Cz04g30070.t1
MEWWALFFELAVIVLGLAATPSLIKSRYVVSTYLSMTSVLLMVVTDYNLTDLWTIQSTIGVSALQGDAIGVYRSGQTAIAGWVSGADGSPEDSYPFAVVSKRLLCDD